MVKKVAILTSGGDAPGMNNAIRSLVRASRMHKIEAWLVFEGYKGLCQGQFALASEYDVDAYINRGGTLIGSARFPEFTNLAVRKKALKELSKRGIEALVVIGGDGSYRGAQALHEMGVKTIALPGTIDNDINSSDFTIGYPTALQTIVENIDRVRDTMESHRRIAIVEVMGHGCGDLALYSGLATGAEIIVTNENLLSAKEIGLLAKKQFAKGKKSVIIVVSEMIFENLVKLEREVEKISGRATRAMSFSHIQRGGVPGAIERINASRMGLKAIELLSQNQSGLAVGIVNSRTSAMPIMEALGRSRQDRASKAQKYNRLNQA
ncbi:6-phosphofructokinase [Mycoplasma sp. ATU-Cv-508]|uniref:6-phosphofructokinase n=1 Tax=Mycoplasma sp. ATU-Cv-508 TaxID=2048001 RepID=UPI000FDE2BEA